MAQWIIDFIELYGLLGIVALMVLENVFPPIPSELIMPFAGFVAARGDMNAASVILAGTVGSLIGTLPWYVAGRLTTVERLKCWAGRHGRWLAVSPRDIDRAQHWFERNGQRAVFFGRMVPAVRSVISAPAGVCAMALPRFLLWSLAGSALWVSALAGLGYALQDNYASVRHWIDPVSKAIVVFAVLGYLWRVVTFKKVKD